MKRLLALFLIAGFFTASGLLAHPLPLDSLGGLVLDNYCQFLGYEESTLLKPELGPNAAYNNWRCVDENESTHPFSMEQACKWEYDLKEVLAHPDDPDDANTWVCYSVAHN